MVKVGDLVYGFYAVIVTSSFPMVFDENSLVVSFSSVVSSERHSVSDLI